MLRKTYKNEIYQFSYAGDDLLKGMENGSWFIIINNNAPSGNLMHGTYYVGFTGQAIYFGGLPNIIIQVINDIINVNISNINLKFNTNMSYDRRTPVAYLFSDYEIHFNIHADALLTNLITATNAYCDPHILDALNRFPYDTISSVSGDAYINIFEDSSEHIDYPVIHLSKCYIEMTENLIPNVVFRQDDSYGNLTELKSVPNNVKVDWLLMNINFKLQLKKKFKVFILNNIKHLQNYYIN